MKKENIKNKKDIINESLQLDGKDIFTPYKPKKINFSDGEKKERS